MARELYDGNQLPENPTSTFQLVVSMLYTLMVTFFFSMGGLAAWASSKRLTAPDDGGSTTGQLQHPTHFMSDLVHKRNSICRGVLAFIPAAYSLAHLYTSSLHSSSLYSAGNVIFAALLAYSATYMGRILQTLVADSDRMDTTKAVYESLYMLASAFDRLCLHTPKKPINPDDKGIFAKVADAQPTNGTKREQAAWQHPWVLFNVFLALAVQDDARLWPMFSTWIRKLRELALLVWVPADPSFWGEILDWCMPTWAGQLTWKGWNKCHEQSPVSPTHVAYAYWLYSQNQRIRTITGSMVVNNGIFDELKLAGYRSRELYYTAMAYIDTLTDHVCNQMKTVNDTKLVFCTE